MNNRRKAAIEQQEREANKKRKLVDRSGDRICNIDILGSGSARRQWAESIVLSVSVIIQMSTGEAFIDCECRTFPTTTYFPLMIFPLTEITNPETI